MRASSARMPVTQLSVNERAASAISEIAADAVHWDDVMRGAAWFHVTGITPALGPVPAQAAIAAAAPAHFAMVNRGRSAAERCTMDKKVG